jgi:hypothetical protein
MTDRAVDGIACLQDHDAAVRAQALVDADQVYLYLRRSEGQRQAPVPEDALRAWAEQEDVDPDRLNLAIAVLTETGRVVALS